MGLLYASLADLFVGLVSVGWALTDEWKKKKKRQGQL